VSKVRLGMSVESSGFTTEEFQLFNFRFINVFRLLLKLNLLQIFGRACVRGWSLPHYIYKCVLSVCLSVRLLACLFFIHPATTSTKFGVLVVDLPGEGLDT
jgi:hypothetical protein